MVSSSPWSVTSISLGSIPGTSAFTTTASLVSETSKTGAQPARAGNSSHLGSKKRSKRRSISFLRDPVHGANACIAHPPSLREIPSSPEERGATEMPMESGCKSSGYGAVGLMWVGRYRPWWDSRSPRGIDTRGLDSPESRVLEWLGPGHPLPRAPENPLYQGGTTTAPT